MQIELAGVLGFPEIIIFYLATLECLCMIFSVKRTMNSKILEMWGREKKKSTYSETVHFVLRIWMKYGGSLIFLITFCFL